MSLIQLVMAEIRGRKMNFLLGLLAIATAAILFIAGPTLVNGYAQDNTVQLTRLEEQIAQELGELDKKTRRIMRDLGVNLRIVHQDTNMGDLYADYRAVDFPEQYVQTLAQSPQIETVVHLVATIQQKITWNDRTILLIGMLPVSTESQKNEEKAHMADEIQRGTVVVGNELATGRSVGDMLEINGREFQIAAIRPPAGSLEDIQLGVHLHDAQELLGLTGRIHQIMALNCKCKGDRLSVIRKELEGVLPDCKVTEHLSRATAREQQRDLVAAKRAEQLDTLKANRQQSEATLATLISIVVPLVVFGSAIYVGVLAWLNVRERRWEIGLLRAIGKRSGDIAAMLLVKSMVLGVAGGVLGCLLAASAYLLLGQMSASGAVEVIGHYRPSPALMAMALLGAPVVSATASYLPMLSAIRQDPAAVLTESAV